MKNHIYGHDFKINDKKTNYAKKYLLNENSKFRKHDGLSKITVRSPPDCRTIDE